MDVKKTNEQNSKNNSAFTPMSFFIVTQFNLNKHNSTPTEYNIKAINDIIYDEKKKIVCRFKEYLLIDETNDFLKRFYKKTETKPRIQKIVNYYHSEFMPCIPNYSKLKQRYVILKNFDKKQKIFAIKKLEKEEAFEKKSTKEKKMKFSTFFKSPIQSSYNSINDEKEKENSLLTISVFEESRNYPLLIEDVSKKLPPNSNALNISSITIIKENKNEIEKSFLEMNFFGENLQIDGSIVPIDSHRQNNMIYPHQKCENLYEEYTKNYKNSIISISSVENKENNKMITDNAFEHNLDNTYSTKNIEINHKTNESSKISYAQSNKHLQNIKSSSIDMNNNNVPLPIQKRNVLDDPPKIDALKFNNLYVENNKSTSRIINTSNLDPLKKINKEKGNNKNKSKDRIAKNSSAISNKPTESTTNNKGSLDNKNNNLESSNTHLKVVQTERKLEKATEIQKTSSYLVKKPKNLKESHAYNTNSRRESGVSTSKPRNTNLNTIKSGTNTANKLKSPNVKTSVLAEINSSKDKKNPNKVTISTSNYMTDLKSPKTVRSNATASTKINFPQTKGNNSRKNILSSSVQPKLSQDYTNIKLKFNSNHQNTTSVRPVSKNINDNLANAYQTNTTLNKTKISNRQMMSATPISKETKTFSIKLDLGNTFQTTKPVVKSDKNTKTDVNSINNFNLNIVLLGKKYSDINKLKSQNSSNMNSTAINSNPVRTSIGTSNNKTNLQTVKQIPSSASTPLNKVAAVAKIKPLEENSKYVNSANNTIKLNNINTTKNSDAESFKRKSQKTGSIEIEKVKILSPTMKNFTSGKITQNLRSVSKRK